MRVVKKALERAIQNQEFLLYYQPQFTFASSSILGVEALLRWQYPKKGLLFPAQFIPLAEETGLITHLGAWLLEAVCRQNKIWQEHGLMPLQISVNVSPKQIQQKKFVVFIKNLLKRYHLPPQYLELELTENIILHQDKNIIRSICRLKELGVLIALDDFGTGYSSISHLKKIPIDRIKIDKTYIQKMHINRDDAAIVKAIIALASALNIQVLAEGVESQAQLELLLSQGCQAVQGFYFSKPLSPKKVEKFLLLHQNK